jgi:hypothetical protein
MSDKPAELSTKQTVGVAYAGLGAVFGIAAGVSGGVIGWLVALFWGVAVVILLLGAIGAALSHELSATCGRGHCR